MSYQENNDYHCDICGQSHNFDTLCKFENGEVAICHDCHEKFPKAMIEKCEYLGYLTNEAVDYANEKLGADLVYMK